MPAVSDLTVFDRTAWSRIRLTGADRVRFLHNQTTNNIEQIRAGQGCYTVFVTSTGRTLDLATVYAFPDALLVVASPGMAKPLYDWMDRYIFFSDKVTLTDESDQSFLFTVLGDGADQVARVLGAADLVGQANFQHCQVADSAAPTEPISVAVGSDLAIAGYTVWGPVSQSQRIWQTILAAGASPGTDAQWEHLRIQQGRPMPQHELTDDDNPLEAGLWHAVSFEKGCYIGQETIARLNTYQGVKKRLWGFALAGDNVDALNVSEILGAALWHDSAKVGKITSVAKTDSGLLALGYLRSKAGGEGLIVEVKAEVKAEDTNAQVSGTAPSTVTGTAVSLPFIGHEYYSSH